MGLSEGACPPSDSPSQISDSRGCFLFFFVAGTASFEKKLIFEEYHIATMTENWKKSFKDVI